MKTIAQVEFFLNTDKRSLEELLNHSRKVVEERFFDLVGGVTTRPLGSGIKTVVRIRDPQGLLAEQVRAYLAFTKKQSF